jgi:hypothetical protein
MHRETALAVVVALTTSVFVTAPPAFADEAAQRATIETVRSVGKAMFFHVASQAVAGKVPCGGGDTGSESASSEGASEQPGGVYWSRCPEVSYDEANALLAPYLEPDPLPRVDGWGHALQFCIRRAGSGLFVGIRSPGRDGRFEGDVYQAGPFAPDELGRDLVWIDGYFVTWPQRQP